jgi:hypothetical protein
MDSPISIARALSERQLADLPAGLGQVAPAWRALVEHNVVWFIAGRIIALPAREDRAAALEAVPEPWRAKVAAVVAMVFAARLELRQRTFASAGSA